MNVVDIPVTELHLDPANARKHGDRNLEAIKASLAAFGQQKPIVVDGDNVVRAGNGTLRAAQALGWTSIACVRTDLTGAKAIAFAIADNRASELAEWEDGILGQQLDAIRKEGLQLDSVGFSDLELKRLLAKGNTGKTDPDAIPEPVNVSVKPGEVWILGDHRIACGSCTDDAIVDRLMAGAKARICWTDPPWNVAYGTHGDHPKKREIANDNLGDKFPEFCRQFIAQIVRCVQDGAPLYMAMSAQEWPTIDGGLRAAGFHWSSTVIWAKDRLVLSRKDYHTQYEPIWYGWLGTAPRLCPVEDRKQSDLWSIPRPHASEEHPTMKPVELVARSLQNSSHPADVVFEPFSGSGTTLLACEQTGRACRAVELEPKYVQVAIDRWEAFTGQKAQLEQ